MVILNAGDGKILETLPIGAGSDGAVFNPKTMEAFSSQGDGTLTIVKENSPTSFVVEQTLQTAPRAKTLTLDRKTNHLLSDYSGVYSGSCSSAGRASGTRDDGTGDVFDPGGGQVKRA